MELPEFKTLCDYAAGIGDLPQRFYMTLENEEICDLRLQVSSKVLLPVHKTILAFHSRLFHPMLTACMRADGDVLPIEDKYNLAAILALLRFIYEPSDLCAASVEYLHSKKLIVGVFEIASFMDYKKFDLLVSLAKPNITIDDISSLWAPGFDNVQDACAEFLINTEPRPSGKGVMAMRDWCDALPDDPKLLKIALVAAVLNGKKPECGDASDCTKLVKSIAEGEFSARRLGPATCTYAMTKEQRVRGATTTLVFEGAKFTWNGLRFSMVFQIDNDDDKLGFYVKTHQDLEAGQMPSFELRVVNSKYPSESITKLTTKSDGWKNGAGWGFQKMIKVSEADTFADPFGVIYAQVTFKEQNTPPVV